MVHNGLKHILYTTLWNVKFEGFLFSVDRVMVMQMGHVNSIGMFCPIALMLSNKETSAAMKFGLTWAKDENVGSITAMMGDASLALSKALRDVMPEPETFNLMCYFHMLR